MIDFLINNPVLLAAISSLVGGVVLKLLEKWMGKNTEKRNDAKDYRETVKELNDRLDKVEEEVSTWRQKAFDLQEEVAHLRVFIVTLGQTPPERPQKP